MAFRDDVAHTKKEIDAKGNLEQIQDRAAYNLAHTLADAVKSRLLQTVEKQYYYGKPSPIRYHGYMLILDFKKTLFSESVTAIRQLLKRDTLHTFEVSTLANFTLSSLQSELASDNIAVGPYLLISKPYFPDEEENWVMYKNDEERERISIDFQYTFVDNISRARCHDIEAFPRLTLPAGLIPGGNVIRFVKDGHEIYNGERSNQGETIAIEINADL